MSDATAVRDLKAGQVFSCPGGHGQFVFLFSQAQARPAGRCAAPIEIACVRLEDWGKASLQNGFSLYRLTIAHTDYVHVTERKPLSLVRLDLYSASHKEEPR
jgi:hypothetical protein